MIDFINGLIQKNERFFVRHKSIELDITNQVHNGSFCKKIFFFLSHPRHSLSLTLSLAVQTQQNQQHGKKHSQRKPRTRLHPITQKKTGADFMSRFFTTFAHKESSMTASNFIKFIQEHENDDPNQLILSAHKYPGIDVRFAAEQIIARKTIKDKLPEWHARKEIVYPSRLSTEQCSSETTARYKQGLVRGNTVCDLTGGLGVDSYYFSQVAQKVIYVERMPEYVESAIRNFQWLEADNITCESGDAYQMAKGIQADTFYLDPARRAKNNRRMFALADCEPDILQLKSILLEKARRLIIKISPMADLTETLRLLPETQEIHILAVKNECKELLFVLENAPGPKPVSIQAVNFTPQGTQTFHFTQKEEREANAPFVSTHGNYLYEPNAAILKSGAFKTPALRYGLDKLERHSHLYMSPNLVADFPGRIFAVEQTLDFSSKLLKTLGRTFPKANITVRNFPLTVAELRKRSGIQDGGDTYLFATTIHPQRTVLLISHKI